MGKSSPGDLTLWGNLDSDIIRLSTTLKKLKKISLEILYLNLLMSSAATIILLLLMVTNKTKIKFILLKISYKKMKFYIKTTLSIFLKNNKNQKNSFSILVKLNSLK